MTKLTEVREALQNNKDLRLFLEEDKSVGKYNVEKFLDYSSFTQNNGDTSVFDLPLKKGGLIIFDEFCFHRGGPPINSDRVVMRFFYRPKKKLMISKIINIIRFSSYIPFLLIIFLISFYIKLLRILDFRNYSKVWEETLQKYVDSSIGKKNLYK